MAQNFDPVYKEIENYGIIPIIKTEDAEIALAAAKALSAGGLNVAEMIFETEKAEKAAEKIIAALPGTLLVAGGAKSKKQAKGAADSGAKAIITDGFDAKMAECCENLGIPLLIKIKNAEETKKMPEAKFIVDSANPDDFAKHLSNKALLACSIDIIPQEAYAGGFGEIKKLAAHAVQKMLGYDLAHVGINCENAEQAERDSGRVEAIFGLEKTDAGATFSNADILHFTKQRSYGKNGQIAISANFIDRALFYLKQAGRQFIEESARYDEQGILASIYLDNIIGGFAIKLVRRETNG
ncbi:MAG: hypothetical protein FWG34_02730 [Oscillospiraceae bacterium]|nr:hypothetical protein [Oscillospiraceae bacterium]